MAQRKPPQSRSARSLSAWRAKNPVAALVKLLTRRVLAVERQIDQDDQRLFELNSELVEVRNRLQMRTRAAAVAISDLTRRLKVAEQNLADHEQTIGALAVVALSVLGRKPLDVSAAQLESALRLVETYSGRSRSETESSQGSLSHTKNSKSPT